MKKLVAVLCLAASTGFAGEKYLGTIAGTSGPTAKNNNNTAAPFVIPPMAQVTIQCDAAAYIATDTTTATSTNGVKVNADTAFPTSVGSSLTTVSSVRSSLISVIGASGAVNCKVFERRGNE